MSTLTFILIALASYLIGAIPVGLIVGRLWGVDVTAYGSGKIGATNVLRTIGKRAAALVLAGDLAKGVIAVLLARFALGGDNAPLVSALPRLGESVAALCAIVGHNWSVFIRFRGGRGATTGCGALIIIAPWVVLIAVGIDLVIVILFRYVSLGNIAGAISVAVLLLIFYLLGWQQAPSYLIYGFVGSALIVFQHRGNIVRLLSGTERKLGQRAEGRSEKG